MSDDLQQLAYASKQVKAKTKRAVETGEPESVYVKMKPMEAVDLGFWFTAGVMVFGIFVGVGLAALGAIAWVILWMNGVRPL